MSNAANLIESPYDETRSLPQFGFGSDVTFESISRYHRYLFRVYTPKSLPAVEDQTVFFVGARFNNTFAPRTPIMSEMYSSSSSCAPLVDTATYEDCVQHLSWETRSRSPFISASFSFAWALWDAVRRFNNGIKHDVEIAVIDAAALSGKAVTTLQLLRRSSSTESRHPRHWRWCRFAQESQSVLIHGFVPRSAVLASIPLRMVIQNLPSYFLKTPSGYHNNSLPIETPLGMILAWDPIGQKNANFRRFCQEMGDRFRRLPYQIRAREIAIGSVRLAMTLLGPWFHRTVEHGDIHSAVTRIRELSALIAHWPEQPGSRDYTEMASLMRALILLLAEESQCNNSLRRQIATEEVLVHLNSVSPGFPEESRGQSQQATDLVSSDSDSGSMTVLQDSEEEISPRRSLSKLKIAIPSSASSEASSFSPCSSPSSASPRTPDSNAPSTSPPYLELDKPQQSEQESPSPVLESSSTPSYRLSQQPRISCSPNSPPLTIDIPVEILSPIMSPGAPSASIYYSALRSPRFTFSMENANSEREQPCDDGGAWDLLPAEHCMDEDEPEWETDSDSSSSVALHEVVSYAVTGFVVGTAITLYILFSQRRTMLYLT